MGTLPVRYLSGSESVLKMTAPPGANVAGTELLRQVSFFVPVHDTHP